MYHMTGLHEAGVRHTVYIAGPDVFSLDWPAFAARVSSACERFNLEPIFPIPPDQSLDREGVPGITIPGSITDAENIYRQCLAQIQKADAVVANITPFRGLEPDSGTVFEIAIASAQGKMVVAYSRDRQTLISRLMKNLRRTRYGGWLCRHGWLIERFNLPCNVMVAQACVYTLPQSDVEKALEVLRQGFDGLFF